MSNLLPCVLLEACQLLFLAFSPKRTALAYFYFYFWLFRFSGSDLEVGCCGEAEKEAKPKRRTRHSLFRLSTTDDRRWQVSVCVSYKACSSSSPPLSIPSPSSPPSPAYYHTQGDHRLPFEHIVGHHRRPRPTPQRARWPRHPPCPRWTTPRARSSSASCSPPGSGARPASSSTTTPSASRTTRSTSRPSSSSPGRSTPRTRRSSPTHRTPTSSRTTPSRRTSTMSSRASGPWFSSAASRASSCSCFWFGGYGGVSTCPSLQFPLPSAVHLCLSAFKSHSSSLYSFLIIMLFVLFSPLPNSLFVVWPEFLDTRTFLLSYHYHYIPFHVRRRSVLFWSDGYGGASASSLSHIPFLSLRPFKYTGFCCNATTSISFPCGF